jgi:hypothetical protein
MRKAEQNIATPPSRIGQTCALGEWGQIDTQGLFGLLMMGKSLFDPAYPAILKTHLDTMRVKR